jgi:hypothetical protein
VRWTTRLARGVGPFLSSKASYDVASNICQALCDGPSELLAQVEGLRLAAVHHWQGRGREPKRLGAGGRGPGAGGRGPGARGGRGLWRRRCRLHSAVPHTRHYGAFT